MIPKVQLLDTINLTDDTIKKIMNQSAKDRKREKRANRTIPRQLAPEEMIGDPHPIYDFPDVLEILPVLYNDGPGVLIAQADIDEIDLDQLHSKSFTITRVMNIGYVIMKGQLQEDVCIIPGCPTNIGIPRPGHPELLDKWVDVLMACNCGKPNMPIDNRQLL